MLEAVYYNGGWAGWVIVGALVALSVFLVIDALVAPALRASRAALDAELRELRAWRQAQESFEADIGRKAGLVRAQVWGERPDPGDIPIFDVGR